MDAPVAPMLGPAPELETEKPVGLRAAIDGEEEAMRQEKMPVLKKVKERVKKIKDTVKKKTDGHDDEDDEEDDVDPEVHGGLKNTLEACSGGFEEDPAAPTSSEASRERTRAGEEIGMSPVIQSFMAMSVENPLPVKHADEEKGASVSATTKTALEKVSGTGAAAAEKVEGGLGGVGVMLVEKLKPGEEDKALSEVISGAIHRIKTAAGDTVTAASSSAMGGGVGVVGRLREAVASWSGGRRSSLSEQQSKEIEHDEKGRDRQEVKE